MWRPAIRCDSAYRDYIDSLYEVTFLDKNQIMRLMMFVAAHSDEFKQILKEYKKSGVTTLPSPKWQSWEDGYWLNQTYKEKSSGVTPKSLDTTSIKLKDTGGIKFKL